MVLALIFLLTITLVIGQPRGGWRREEERGRATGLSEAASLRV